MTLKNKDQLYARKKTQELWETIQTQHYSNTKAMQGHRNGRKNPHGKGSAGQKTQSEEDGSSASAPLIAHDRLRLANYAL